MLDSDHGFVVVVAAMPFPMLELVVPKIVRPLSNLVFFVWMIRKLDDIVLAWFVRVRANRIYASMDRIAFRVPGDIVDVVP